MEDLPLDIQSKILSHVPLEYAVLSCKLVSKTWETLLSHRKLVGGLLFCTERCGVPKLRFGYHDEVLSLPWADDSAEEEERGKCFTKKLTKITHPPLPTKKEMQHWMYTQNTTADLIGSCNGLVCLSLRVVASFRIFYFSVLNPLTGEYFNLPTIDDRNIHVVNGFGYDPCNNNYKIVCIQYPIGPSSQDKGSVQVYTLGGGSITGWRNIGEINHEGDGILRSECVLWNGSLHWLDKNQEKIVAFDLADEKFRYLPAVNKLSYYRTHLKLLGEYLSIVIMDVGDHRIKIWSFKNKHNDDTVVEVGCQSWTWSLEFNIPTLPGHGYYYKAFAITKNNEVLLWCNALDHDSRTIRPILLCRYDPKTDTLNKVLNLETFGVNKFRGVPHVNSLVSLKSLGVDSNSTTELPANFRKETIRAFLRNVSSSF